MSARPFAIGICLCVAVFLTDQESFAYENSTEIGYIVPSNTIVGISETLRESRDDYYDFSCARWSWDENGFFCHLWVVEFYEPLVDAYSLSPLSVSTTRGTDVDSEHAEVSYSFFPNVHGNWAAQGEHFVRQLVFVDYCWFRSFCTGWFLAGIDYEYLGATAAEHSPIFLDIARYTSVSLSEFTVDTAILPDATELLQTNDGLGDVACPISFRRDGPISVFSVGDGEIDNAEEYREVRKVSGRVKVVDEINWCGRQRVSSNTLGCSGPGEMIVERTDEREGMLWAHEYGHNQGLWISAHSTNRNFLGYATSVSTARRVTQRECDYMRDPID